MEDSPDNGTKNEAVWSLDLGRVSPREAQLNAQVDSLLDEVWEAVLPCVPQHLEGVTVVENMALYVAVRCVSRYRAMTVLIREGYCDDALVLARQFMNECHRLMYLASLKPADRAATVLAAWNQAIDNREQWIDEAERSRDDPDVEEMRDTIKRSRAKLERSRRDLAVGKLRRFPEEGKAIIDAVDRSFEDMVNYKLLTSGFHSTGVMRFMNANVDATGVTQFHVATTSPRQRIGAAEYAIEFAIESALALTILFPGTRCSKAEIAAFKAETLDRISKLAALAARTQPSGS